MRLLIDGFVMSTPEVNRGIGKVFINLVNAIVKAAPFEDYILVCQENADLSAINPWALSRMHVVRLAAIKGNQPLQARAEEYDAQMQEVVSAWNPDIYWNPNPMMLNSYLPKNLDCKTAATMYDIIPVILKEKYFDVWDEASQKEYSARIKNLSKEADLVMGISADASKTFKKYAKRSTSKILPVPISCDDQLFWPSRTSKKTDAPYILIVGGDDPRKNLARATAAFGKFAQISDTQYKLVFCSMLSQKTTDALQKIGKKAGVSDQLVFEGYVSPERLSELYRNATFSYFPSEYEGFGLPILESLKCGTYVTCSKIPTSVEIGGKLLTYFDPADEDSMAAALLKTAEIVDKDAELKTKCLEQAGEFSWTKTAQNYLAHFRETVSPPLPDDSKKQKIAMLTPWPPQKSGIADYSFGVAKAMSKICDLDIYAPDNADDEATDFIAPKGARLKAMSSLPKSRKKYDKYIVHIGNNVEFHKEIYDWLLTKKPENALIVLHDAIIHPFLQHAYLHTGETDTYLDALKFDVNEQTFEELSEIVSQGRNLKIHDYPLSAHLTQFGKLLVHNKFSYDIISEKTESDIKDKISVWPLACEIRDAQPDAEPKKEFEICVFGYVNSNKRPAACVRAFAKLIDFGVPAKLTFIGKVNDPNLKFEEILQSNIPDPAIREKIKLTGFVSEADFNKHLDNADMIWNLRYPTMGESSATLHTALGRSKAIITSDYGQFAEYPDDVIWKVPTDATEIDLLFEMSKFLLLNKDVREQLGENAGNWAKAALDFHIVAQKYLEF